MELYCCGKKLDTSPDKFGEMRSSNDIAGDIDAQKERIEADGYLLFREMIDRQAVLDARSEILLKYAIIGEIDSIRHPVMDAIEQRNSSITQVNMLAFNESVRTGKAYEHVILHPALIAFYEAFMGGPVQTFDFKWPRFVRPGEGTGIHADIVYVGRGTRNLWSSWIPLGDVPREEGSLVVLEGSHQSPKLRNYWNKDADRDHIGWLSENPLQLQENLGGRWLTTDFRAGDVLCFSPRLVHASLDNRSPVGRCRLSSDSRYLLVGEALDDRWNGDISNPHGGPQKAFVPGLSRMNQNKEFEEEWKRVDEYGRLVLTHGGAD